MQTISLLSLLISPVSLLLVQLVQQGTTTIANLFRQLFTANKIKDEERVNLDKQYEADSCLPAVCTPPLPFPRYPFSRLPDEDAGGEPACERALI